MRLQATMYNTLNVVVCGSAVSALTKAGNLHLQQPPPTLPPSHTLPQLRSIQSSTAKPRSHDLFGCSHQLCSFHSYLVQVCLVISPVCFSFFFFFQLLVHRWCGSSHSFCCGIQNESPDMYYSIGNGFLISGQMDSDSKNLHSVHGMIPFQRSPWWSML